MGFWEFVVISVVATIVLGPDKLPNAIRSVVKVKRQVTQMFQGFSNEVNEQLRVHELHENLKKAEQQGMSTSELQLMDSAYTQNDIEINDLSFLRGEDEGGDEGYDGDGDETYFS